MKDLIKQIETEIKNSEYKKDEFRDILNLFPMTEEEERAEHELFKQNELKPENIGKRILYRACQHSANDLGLNSDYMYSRIKKGQIDWENLI